MISKSDENSKSPNQMKSSDAKALLKASFTGDAIKRLGSYFGIVRGGRDQVVDTPFAKGESTAHLLEAWQDQLESVRAEWPTLWDYEIDLAKKVGPLSIEKPLNERIDDIESYFEGILLPSEALTQQSIAAVKSEFAKLGGLRVRDQRRTVELMKKSTSSGSPFRKKKRLVVNQTVPCTISDDDFFGAPLLRYPGGRNYYASALLGWRGQEGGPSESDVKQRVIWMFPFGVNVHELRVYQPLIEAAQRFDLVSAWVSNDAVDKKITSLFDSKEDKDLVVCTDFTKFDQHFNSSLQDAAFAVLKHILTDDASSHEWLDECFPIKYTLPLICDAEVAFSGKHGMGSGSGGTNCDETLAHRALQYEAAQKADAWLNPNSQCLGDDGILSYPGITVEAVVNAYTSHGLLMNGDKQYASTQDCTYLRRWHHKDYRIGGICVGVYSTCRALGRLRYMERWMDRDKWDANAVALRQLSILENCKYHPLKEQFVQFCMKRDKFRLGIDIPDFLDDIVAVARKVTADFPDLLGYMNTLQMPEGLSGISKWWIVNYLLSLR